jgi:uncharacterized protein YdaL
MMQIVPRSLRSILAWALLALALAGPAQAAGPRVLVLYDAPSGTSYDKLGLTYAIMMRNLLGHFQARVDLQPVAKYVDGQIDQYDTTFYMGAVYDHPLPPAFLADAATTTRRLVWTRYNLWQLAWDPAYAFQATRGFAFLGLRGLNAMPTASDPAPGFFSDIRYKGLNFVKYYAWDAARGAIHADPDVGWTLVTDATRALMQVPASNPKTGETLPYVMRSGNFWYVADMPFSFIGPRDRYLVFADLLHDMLGIPHAQNHRALVRLEDVSAATDPRHLKTLSNWLSTKQVPFSIALIPRYRDPLGVYNGGVPEDVTLSEAGVLKGALDHAISRGAELVMHGYTHQYRRMRNPGTAVSGDDFEFWNAVTNSPVAEDSTAWVLGRLDAGLTDLAANGYQVVAWETPHYQASAISSRAFPLRFGRTYHRIVYYTRDRPDFDAAVARDYAFGQIYPYPVHEDHYGQRVVPENLGNLEYDLSWLDPSSNVVYTARDILTNARYMRAVRDGVASFFFHPFLLDPELNVPGLADFKSVVEGISGLGFRWVPASSMP